MTVTGAKAIQMLAPRSNWLRRNRLVAGSLGVSCLLALAFVKGAAWAGNLANATLLALALAVLFGWFEAFKRGHAESHPAIQKRVGIEYKTALLFATLASCAGLVSQTWFRAGTVIAAGDVTLPTGSAWLARVFVPWTWSGSDLGGPSILYQQLPWAAVLKVVESLGGSAEIAQRVWYTSLFVGAAISAAALLRGLGFSLPATAVGVCVYLLNPYVVSTVGSNPVYLAALALLPALPAIVLAAANRQIGVRTAALMIGALAPMFGYLYNNPPLLGMVIAVGVLAPLLAKWRGGHTDPVQAGRALGLGLPLLVFLSAYWLVPAIVLTTGVSSAQFSTASSWVWTEGRASILNGFWLNTTWAWSFPEYFPFAKTYETLPLSVATFLLPTLAFASLVLVRRRDAESSPEGSIVHLRLAVAAGTLALFVIFLGTGTNPPGDLLFDRLYQLPFGWLLREPGRFLMVGGLAYAVLLAVFVDNLANINHFLGWIREPNAAFLRAGRGATVAVILMTVLIAGFPLVTGAVVPGTRAQLPPAHVSMPGYWVNMAAFIDSFPTPGPVLVLPPDDFYQMPYTWGYYGSDRFISDLLKRPALVPSSQGYGTANQELVSAVDLTAKGVVSKRWVQVENLMKALGAGLILVRGDIDTAFPGRTLISPVALSSALSNAPKFDLVHSVGPLNLYAFRGGVSPIIERFPGFATLDNQLPDLRVLSELPAGIGLVNTKPTIGVPLVIQAPPVVSWTEANSSLATDIPLPRGWQYRVAFLGDTSATNGIVSSFRSDTKGESTIHLAVQGKPVIENGNFSEGAWAPVGNCNDTLNRGVSTFLQLSVEANAGPNDLPALRLTASEDTACEAQALKWQGGPLLLTLFAHHIAGAQPRVCVWEIGPNECAGIPAMPESSGWIPYRTAIVPQNGTTGLVLFLYSDAENPTIPTRNEYADVRAIELQSLPQAVLIGTPTQDRAKSSTQLAVLRTTHSPLWDGPPATEHVLVDGLFNGWLVRADSVVRVSYHPAKAVDVGLLVSAIGLLIGVALLLSIPIARLIRRIP